MITEALSHCPGIGPARLKALQALGIRRWQDVVQRSDELPIGWREGVVQECQRCQAALNEGHVSYLVQKFAPHDKWRILAHFLEQTSVFDIETTGLEYDAPISVIACWHRGQLHTFVEHENLDDFLVLLDDVTLLTSFNGSSFDVPRVLDSFHIPRLPCAHLDLRWLAYHRGHRGGLKQITRRIGLRRPHDLADVNGEMAIHLWSRWQHFQDRNARDLLVRYCAADVLLTVMLARHLAGDSSASELWSLLPTDTNEAIPDVAQPREDQQGAFGSGSPARLRAWR